MSKEIPLTNGGFAIVDDEDYENLSQFKWHKRGTGKYRYAFRIEKCKTFSMHRALINVPAGMQTDHIDGNGLNNLRSNLRIATCAQNQFNALGWGGKSNFKGVTWSKEKKKWISKIRITCRRLHLGYFHTELDAAKAYNEAALKYHGAFAKINNI